MTAAGNYYILNSKGEEVLAHCLAHIRNPTLYEPLVHLALSLYEKSFGVSYERIHPLGRWLEKPLNLIRQWSMNL